jgi:hypothetical protein
MAQSEPADRSTKMIRQTHLTFFATLLLFLDCPWKSCVSMGAPRPPGPDEVITCWSLQKPISASLGDEDRTILHGKLLRTHARVEFGK